MNKKIHIIGGGTVYHVTPHLDVGAASVYGNTAKTLEDLCHATWWNEGICAPTMDIELHLTKTAGGKKLETNEDVSTLIDELIAKDSTKVIFMPVAFSDFTVWVEGLQPHEHGKYGKRLDSSKSHNLVLEPAPKVINKVRAVRKDIFLVGFKTTAGFSEDEQYRAGLKLCKNASCNLVFANDVVTRTNMIVTPEEARYSVTKDRHAALCELTDMVKMRSNLTFTRSTVVAGSPIPWNSEMVPSALRTVVDYCIEKNAYKPFQGKTAGHFACKIEDNMFLTSIRKSNFNDLSKIGLVKIVTDGPDTVLAYGAKPSVGGQSQRIVFHDHPEYDCIVHCHVPIREGSKVPVVSQREYECGSHSCGQNTSNGLKKFGNLSAVYLNEHGPNIVFHKSVDPQEVINFIEANFDLSKKTGGYVSE